MYFGFDAVITVAMLMLWQVLPWAYDPAWRVVAVALVGLRGAVVLTRCRPRMWPVVPALVLHVWAGGFANVWPGSWLQAEIHAVAFCCLAMGLTLGAVAFSATTRTCKDRLQVAILAALFVGTATGYYSAPWAMWTRPYTMYWQSACYLALAIAGPPSGLRRKRPSALSVSTTF